MDADNINKVKHEIEYLDEMIKGEAINIQRLNKEAKKYFKQDYVGNDVEKEKRMVAVESEVARVKIKINNLTNQSLQNQEEEIKIDEQIQVVSYFYQTLEDKYTKLRRRYLTPPHIKEETATKYFQ